MSMAEICYPCVGFVAVVKRSWPDPFSDHGLLEFVRRSFLFVTAMWVRCRQIKVLLVSVSVVVGMRVGAVMGEYALTSCTCVWICAGPGAFPCLSEEDPSPYRWVGV
ncbi:hypothetical protein Tco_0990620 [Tanacetum coccineum]|uniref:Uncharacterized protein n=1 Tax=Tanacetum coccineum TaxID=301880 RepID=A0ABQ5EX11_9ASTR